MFKKILFGIVIFGNLAPSFGFPCNGKEEFCDRKYSDITQIKTHNATSITTKGKFSLPNFVADQNRPLEKQLEDGIRAFKIPVHPVVKDGKTIPWVTHTVQKRELFETIDKNKKFIPEVVVNQLKKSLINNVWKMDSSNMPLIDFLTILKNYLDTHPHEVITLVLNTFTMNEMKQQFLDTFITSGMGQYLHIQDKNQPWPTLKEMITKNKRMVVFVDTNVNQAGFHYTPHFVRQNSYSFKNSNELNKDTCSTFDKPLKTPSALYEINHFITPGIAGSESEAKKANKYEALKSHVTRCNRPGIRPNFIHVDFYDMQFDDIKRVVDELNKTQ